MLTVIGKTHIRWAICLLKLKWQKLNREMKLKIQLIWENVGLIPWFFSLLCVFFPWLTKISVHTLVKEDQGYKLIHVQTKQTSKQKASNGDRRAFSYLLFLCQLRSALRWSHSLWYLSKCSVTHVLQRCPLRPPCMGIHWHFWQVLPLPLPDP